MLGLGYYLADVLNPFLIALLIAYVLNPLVELLERRRVRRSFAVTVIFGALIVGIGAALIVGGFSAADHLEEVRDELAGDRVLDERNPVDLAKKTDMLEKHDQRLRQDPEGHWFIDERFSGKRKIGLIETISTAMQPRLRSIPQTWIESVTRAVEAQAGEALNVGVQASKGLQTFISSLWNFFGYVFLVPLYAFFLLLSFSDMQRVATAHLPGLYRDRVISIVARIDRALAAFFRGRLILAIARMLFTWGALYLVGVRFAFLVGVVSGVLSVVPFLGMIVGAPLAIAFAYEPVHWGARCVAVLIVFSVTETLESVLYPTLIGKNVGLHPLAFILSLFCFGRIFGLFGVLLAVPIACVVKILFVEFVLPEIKALAAEKPDQAPPPLSAG